MNRNRQMSMWLDCFSSINAYWVLRYQNILGELHCNKRAVNDSFRNLRTMFGNNSVYIYMYVHIYLHTYTHMYTHIQTYIHAYMYIHPQTLEFFPLCIIWKNYIIIVSTGNNCDVHQTVTMISAEHKAAGADWLLRKKRLFFCKYLSSRRYKIYS